MFEYSVTVWWNDTTPEEDEFLSRHRQIENAIKHAALYAVGLVEQTNVYGYDGSGNIQAGVRFVWRDGNKATGACHTRALIAARAIRDTFKAGATTLSERLLTDYREI